MTVIHVRSFVEYKVDTEAFVKAAIEEEYVSPGEIDPSDPEDVVSYIVDHEEESLIARWARDSVQLTATTSSWTLHSHKES
jgi:hypothetical protein